MAPLVARDGLILPGYNNTTLLMRESTPLGNGTSFSHNQEYALQSIAVSFASFSLACSVVTFYWFLRMRRSYRHDLIMLLIQSDTWKILWLMMYPIVVFVHGPISNQSVFCQVNGFMFAVGVEASDFAVLMIAVHSLLTIFKRHGSSETGLYPYRRIAYAAWIAFPITMASLAFVNGSNAYTISVTYCYLPVRPFWYRLALSWIPRYCIFIIIMVIYASIYFYVRFRFDTFQRESHSDVSTAVGNSASLGTMTESRKRKRFSLPTTPKLMLHGLISGSRSRSLGTSRRHSVASTEDWKRSSASTVYSAQREAAPGHLSWTTYVPHDSTDTTVSPSHTAPPNTESTQSFGSLTEHDMILGRNINDPLPAMPFPSLPRRAAISQSSFLNDPVIGRPLPSVSETHSRSVFTMIAALRTRPTDVTATDSTPISQLELVDSNGDNIALNTVMATREKIRRQLRLLFIYPLVYMGMWTLPFVFHVLQYNERYALNPPFVLTCCVTIILAMQCAVDCLLFCSREQPWKHISNTSGGFVESFRFWEALNGNRRGSSISVTGRGGMSREEMVMQARRAYMRREQEIAARTALVREAGFGAQGRQERSWWDNGFDGTGSLSSVPMGTVIEEWDPLDTRGVQIPNTVAEARMEAEGDNK